MFYWFCVGMIRIGTAVYNTLIKLISDWLKIIVKILNTNFIIENIMIHSGYISVWRSDACSQQSSCVAVH